MGTTHVLIYNTLLSNNKPLDKQVVKVASEGSVVQSKVGAASDNENNGGYSARSNTYERVSVHMYTKNSRSIVHV